MAARDRVLGALQSTIRTGWHFFKGLSQHDIQGLSAEFAFYFLLSLFPMLLFFAALLSHLASVPETLNIIFNFLGAVFPPEIVSLVQRDIGKWVASGSVAVFSVSVLLYGWSGSRVFAVMLKGFNRIYGKRERSALRIRMMSTTLVLVSAFALGSVFLINLFAKELRTALENKLPFFMGVFLTYHELITTPLVMFIVAFALYRLFPAPKHSIRASAMGAAFFTVATFITTSFFRLYTQYSMVNSLYGAIGTIIIALMWMYFLGTIFFIGAEINVAILNEVKPHAEEED